MRSLLALVVVAGCAGLADVQDDGTCGNYVVDPNEDCDGGPSGAAWCTSSCQLVCQDAQCIDANQAVVPNYRCGIDGLCHAPSGVLASETAAFPFAPVSVTTTDIDGDGIQDMVGVTLDTEVVVYGARDGALGRQSVALVPGTNGLGPTFADIDGDGHLDPIIPTPNGLVAMSSSSGVPLPFPFANAIDRRAPCEMNAQARGVVSFDGQHMVTLVAKDGALVATVLDIADSSCSGGFVSACGLADPPASQNQAPTVVAVGYDTSTRTTNASAEIAITDGTNLCVMTVVESGGVFQLAAAGAITNATGLTASPVFAQIDGTSLACPQLLIGDQNGTWKYPATTLAGGCSIDATATPVMIEQAGIVPIAHAEVAPPVAGAAPDLLVVSAGTGLGAKTTINAYVAGSAQPLLTNNEPFSTVEAADLDGDGVTELVAASRFSNDVQILYRTTAPDGFLVDRVPTDGLPVAIVLRDFDGNGLRDIAILEALTAGSELAIAYSTSDRPLPPVAVASFTGTVLAVLPVQTPDVLDPYNNVQDIVVLQLLTDPVTSRPLPSITLLHGSPERTMFAYFDPRSQTAVASSKFEKVLAGSFFSPGASDLLAFESDTTRGTFVWGLANNGGLLDSNGGEQPLPGISFDTSCSDQDVLCGLTAAYTTIPLPGHDVAIAIDAFHHMVTIDPAGGPGQPPALTSSNLLATLPEPPGPGTLLFRTVAADLDGDGRAELILPLRPNGYAAVAGSRVVVCHVGDAGQITDCANLGASDGPLANYDCSDAQAGRLTDRGRDTSLSSSAGLDLVVACSDPTMPDTGKVFALHAEPDGTYTRTTLLDQLAYYIQVGDITGDGVDDLMALQFDPMRRTPAIHVFPQCDVHAGCGAPQ